MFLLQYGIYDAAVYAMRRETAVGFSEILG